MSNENIKFRTMSQKEGFMLHLEVGKCCVKDIGVIKILTPTNYSFTYFEMPDGIKIRLTDTLQDLVKGALEHWEKMTPEEKAAAKEIK